MEKPRKLQSGRYQARVKDAHGGRINPTPGVTYNTRKEAQAAQIRYYEETNGGTVDTSILFRDYAEIVIQARQGEASAHTLANEARYIRNWLMPQFGAMRVVDIRYTTIKAWINGLELGSGRRSAYLALMTVLEHALQDQIIKVKPRVRHAADFVGEAKPLYPAAQIHAVLDNLPDFARTFFLVQWGAALRISEALGLDWSAIDLEAGLVHVRQQYYKGELTDRLKTKKSYRTVALTEDALDELRALRQAQPSIGNTPVFVDPRTNQRLKANRAYDLWKAARAAAGVPDIVPQALRRNDLTNYRNAVGGDLIKTMARGGHGDIRSAQTYQVAGVDTDLEVMRTLSEAKRRAL